MAVPAPSMVASGQLLCPPIPLCWRFSDVNAQYTLCDSYPSEIVVPAGMADEELVAVSGFRRSDVTPRHSCWVLFFGSLIHIHL